LIPEIPYDPEVLAGVITRRAEEGKRFTILAVAEGAISKEDAALSGRELREKKAKNGYPSVAYEVAARLQDQISQEIRITVPGHIQRGGTPCPYDRVLSTRLGAFAARLILDGEYGYMAGVRNGEIRKVPLSEVAGKLKYVNPESGIVREARQIGISFGE
jgi:6-phosphofructokinase 1